MKYKIIDVFSIEDLMVEVNVSLANGWQPKGGMVSYCKAGDDTMHFAQALIISDAEFEAELEKVKVFRYD